jgi:hypothetical protein
VLDYVPREWVRDSHIVHDAHLFVLQIHNVIFNFVKETTQITFSFESLIIIALLRLCLFGDVCLSYFWMFTTFSRLRKLFDIISLVFFNEA